MNRIQLSTNLNLDEYIPRELYMQYADHPEILMGLLDTRLIKSDQLLRDKFGSVMINNWWGLTDEQFKFEMSKPDKDKWLRNESGFRFATTEVGAKLSQHKFGRASDKLFVNTKALCVQEYIINNFKELGITCIETDIPWVHTDVRQVANQKILLTVHP